MALTNDEKLILFKRAVSLYIEKLNTWTAAKTLTANITKTKFQGYVKTKMQELQAEASHEAELNAELATKQTQKAADIEALATEIEDV